MYARVGLKGGGRMKHQKEWCTCDRCGKEIKAGLLGTNSITRDGVLNTTYDLCNECMEDFWGFMRNEEHYRNYRQCKDSRHRV